MPGSLIQLALEGTDDARRRLFSQVSDLVVANLEDRTDRELAIFSEVALKLYDAGSEKDRSNLAQRLANKEKTPHTLAKRIAQDAVQVAGPVLEGCPVLTQQDLLEFVATLSLPHLQIIARRTDICQMVSDKLVDRGDEPVHRILAANLKVSLSRHAINELARRSETDTLLCAALASRKDLPMPVCQSLLPYTDSQTKKRLQSLIDEALSKAQQEQVMRLKQLRRDLGKALDNSDMSLLSRDADRFQASPDDIMVLLLQDSRFDHSVEFLGIKGRTAQKSIRNAVYDGKIEVVLRAALKANLEGATFAMFARARCNRLKLAASHASDWTSAFVKRQSELIEAKKARGVDFQAKRNIKRQARG